LPLFFLVGSPWYIFMSVKHGWPFWNEYIFYHHLGRMEGTIDKPDGTFEMFIQQLGYGTYPWSGFMMMAMALLTLRANPLGTASTRRNLFLLLSILIPYMFFSLSGTKFNHYIFPVVPFLAVLVGVILAGFMPAAAGLDGTATLQEDPDKDGRIHTPGTGLALWTGGEVLRIFIAFSIIWFVVFSRDLILNYHRLVKIFIYYTNRPVPPEYRPHILMQVLFYFPFGAVMGLALFRRRLGSLHLAAFGVIAVVFAAYCSWVMMPAMGDTYTLKPLWMAYKSLSKAGEPVGDYTDWEQPRRSLMFVSANKIRHLKRDKDVELYLKTPGRKFIITDRNRLPQLRNVAREGGQTLYVVADNHPYARLVSNEKGEREISVVSQYKLTAPPPDMQPIGADFEGKVTLLGYKLHDRSVHAGDSAKVSLYFRCDSLLDRDWQIFIHGDGPRNDRLHSDHFPLNGLYSTTEWQPGEILEDTFDIDVPLDFKGDFFLVWTGWYEGNDRLRVTNNAPNDGDNRVRGPRIDVTR
jgi:hypothetical protein